MSRDLQPPVPDGEFNPCPKLDAMTYFLAGALAASIGMGIIIILNALVGLLPS